jgi:hypothetical protein
LEVKISSPYKAMRKRDKIVKNNFFQLSENSEKHPLKLRNFLFFLFGDTDVLTPGFTLARQALYHFSLAPDQTWKLIHDKILSCDILAWGFFPPPCKVC